MCFRSILALAKNYVLGEDLMITVPPNRLVVPSHTARIIQWSSRTMEHHHVQCVNPVETTIFNSYVELPKGI